MNLKLCHHFSFSEMLIEIRFEAIEGKCAYMYVRICVCTNVICKKGSWSTKNDISPYQTRTIQRSSSTWEDQSSSLQSCQCFLQSNANNVVLATTTKYRNDVSQLIN